ncbi:MAG: hypothetical protein HY721_25500 [Planctomycetes bacterium]|nr:hypothetical protein [Planctomycetota bacterium]
MTTVSSRTLRAAGAVILGTALLAQEGSPEASSDCALEVLAAHVPPELARLLERIVEEAASETRVTIQLEGADVRTALDIVARSAGVTLAIAADVEAQVTLRLDGVRWHEALARIARAAGCKVVEPEGGAGEPLRIVRPEPRRLAAGEAEPQGR